MKIVAQANIKVSDLVNGYLNDTATGAVEAYNGRLNVRPAYQREFVWDKGSTTGDKKQEALIDSIMKGYPINGTTTPDNLQMLCHSCNLDKLNKPFDKVAEERRLQEIYSMTDDEIAALPEGGKD